MLSWIGSFVIITFFLSLPHTVIESHDRGYATQRPADSIVFFLVPWIGRVKLYGSPIASV